MENRLSRTGGGGSDTRAEPEAHDATSSRGTDVLGILEDIESQFERLRTIRRDQVEALRDVAERSTQLDERETSLARDRQALDEKTTTWSQEQQREQQAIDDGRTCLEADRESHARRQTEDKDTLARDRESLDEDRERSRRESETVRVGLARTRAELEALQDELDDRAAAHEDARTALDAEAARIRDEAVATEEEHHRLLDALRVARRDIGKRGRWIKTLVRGHETLRNQRRKLRARRRALECAGRVHRRRISDLEDRSREQDAQLEETGRRMQGFMEHLREQADVIQRGHAALALVEELRNQVDELESRLEAVPESGPPPTETLARVEELERELESARDELAHVKPAMQELEDLRKARCEANPEVEATIEDRTQRLGEVAQHLHRRRTRLKRMREAIAGTRSTQAGGDQPEAVQQRLRQSEIIEQRQRELDDVQRMLASSEKKMIKRWAAPGALVLTSWTLVVLLIVAVLSWYAAERFRPAVRTASVVIAPRLDSGEQLDEEASRAWVAFHESQLGSDRFIHDVAKRAAARRLSPWDSQDAVERLVRNGVAVDTGEPGRIVLTLPSEDPNRAASFLDLLATNMAVGAKRSIASRPGGHVSKVLDDRTDDGILRYSRIDWSPQRDDRLATAGVFFGGGVLLVILAMSLVYGRLLRAKRIFEQSHPVDLDMPITPARPI